MEKSTLIGMLLIVALFFAATTLMFWMKIDSLSANSLELKAAVDERDIVIANANSNITYANQVIANMRANITQRNEIIEMLNQRLNQSYSDYENLSGILSETETELYGLRSEIDAAVSKVDRLNRDINDSMKWFRDNSILPPSLSREHYSLKSDCVSRGGDGVTVNLGCIPNTMKNAFGFNYRTDLLDDRLYSLDEMVSNSGGDCEDYSIFLAAFLNSIKQEYGGGGQIALLGWEQDPGSGGFFPVTPKGQWGYMDAKAHDLGDLGELTPYMVCYITEYDAENRTKAGHCVVALSRFGSVSTYEDLEGLAGSELFEPQTGEYIGKIGRDLILCKQGEDGCENRINSIMSITTGSDLYNFADSEWSSYSMWQESTSSLVQKLNGLKG